MKTQEDLIEEAKLTIEARELWQAWMAARVEQIHQRVTVYDVLQRNGIQLRYSDVEQQISCPFHGKDTHPSARVYPSDGRGPSHVWCFACNERWDCIGLWKKFDSMEDAKFGAILRSIENSFDLTPPPRPERVPGESQEDTRYAETLIHLDKCDSRLKTRRGAFDMVGFLRLSVVLDRLYQKMAIRGVDCDKVGEVVDQVLAKIAEREKDHVDFPDIEGPCLDV